MQGSIYTEDEKLKTLIEQQAQSTHPTNGKYLSYFPQSTLLLLTMGIDGEKLYEVRQDISVVLENQPPGIETAALYVVIDQEHEGTLEDPIPYDQMMEVFAGKYYLEDGIIYICNRDSGQPLYATCASLAGDSRSYFSVVE